jgi:formylglycine-generating enzyme required for sulfatase activity
LTSLGKLLSRYPELNTYIEAMCKIPDGTFQMGSASGAADERPIHSVTISAFRMAATPITVAIWKEYCIATGSTLPPAPDWGLLDDHPIVNVSWNDIMGLNGDGGFCAWASDVAGFRLTLPTEAQFEYATIGGKSQTEFPWGDVFDRSKLWCSDNEFSDAASTAPANRLSRTFCNAYGLTDMSGNVWQWCLDVYAPYSNEATTDPSGPTKTRTNERCVRGGSWFSIDSAIFRLSTRFRNSPAESIDGIGFRLVAAVTK